MIYYIVAANDAHIVVNEDHIVNTVFVFFIENVVPVAIMDTGDV